MEPRTVLATGSRRVRHEGVLFLLLSYADTPLFDAFSMRSYEGDVRMVFHAAKLANYLKVHKVILLKSLIFGSFLTF